MLGVGLLFLTLIASFTGYLLPWDQLAYWAITVGTSVASYEPVMGKEISSILLGGPEVGQESLIRFYTLHIAVVPLFLGRPDGRAHRGCGRTAGWPPTGSRTSSRPTRSSSDVR